LTVLTHHGNHRIIISIKLEILFEQRIQIIQLTFETAKKGTRNKMKREQKINSTTIMYTYLNIWDNISDTNDKAAHIPTDQIAVTQRLTVGKATRPKDFCCNSVHYSFD
jgi:hypothetical protein